MAYLVSQVATLEILIRLLEHLACHVYITLHISSPVLLNTILFPISAIIGIGAASNSAYAFHTFTCPLIPTSLSYNALHFLRLPCSDSKSM